MQSFRRSNVSMHARSLGSIAFTLALGGFAAACGSSGDDDGADSLGSTGGAGMPATGGATNGSGGTGTTTGGSAGSGGSEPTWPTGPIRPTRYRIPDAIVDEAPCSASGTGTIGESEVLLGQTHLTPPGWPFQTISANRPLTVAVAAEGSGSAPALTMTATLDGASITLCLNGPESLPSDHTDLASSTYRATLPASWVAPGLELSFSVGDETVDVTPVVHAENGLTLYVVDAELFGEGTNEAASDAQWIELLARLPVSHLDVGKNPFGAFRPAHLLVEARDDGRTPSGAATSHPALVIDENPHCSSADQAANTCTLHSGYGTMSAVLRSLDTFREANGLARASTWYADLAVALGGGLAGGQRGTGDDTDLTMNHELGHAWGFPHWGASHTDYPYEGVQRDRGGFGDRYGFDQARDLLLDPTCEGQERQSPMQRANTCLPDGSWFDPFSDYEAARLLRMTLGASEEIAGNVDYAGGVAAGSTRPFVLPEETGRDALVFDAAGPGFTLARYDEATNSFLPFESEAWNRVEASEVPVTMFYGGLIRGGDAFVEEPIEYVGNVLRSLDPSDPDDYAELYERRSSDFYWASDLNFRFTLEDGTVLHRIYGGEAELRVDGDEARFAMNLPRELADEVVKCEILSRPLGQYSESSRLDETDSAANYFDQAVVLAAWER